MKLVNRFALSLILSGLLTVPAWAQDTGSSSGSAGQASGAGAGQSSEQGAGQSSGQDQAAGSAQGKAGARTDRMFVQKAAAGGMLEVQLGKLAQEKAADQQVKDFGKRMEDEHSKANEQLMGIANTMGVTPPSSLPAKEQAKVDKLSKLSGADFDRQYMTMMVSEHRKDVRDFQRASKTAKDESLKNFATSTLPTLQEHLKQAQELHGKVGGKAAGESASKKPADQQQ
ncbi:MAG TPA: DUF4142 domain-containing protein [Terriglobales bacterium]|nr:DUF4142 domain-containing protein [Terriglobales bacterium]